MTAGTTTARRRPGHARHAAGPNQARSWRRFVHLVSLAGVLLVSVVAALTMVIAIATHLSSRSQVTAFGHPLLTVLSGSMAPVIKTGDLIIDDSLSPAQSGRLRPGQIISFEATPGSTLIITHRIVARVVADGKVFYRTKGDANNAPDSQLRPASDVIGLYVASIPRGGYVLSALHQPLVPILLAVSAALFFLAGPLFRLARDLDRREVSSTHPKGDQHNDKVSQEAPRAGGRDNHGRSGGCHSGRRLHLRSVQRHRKRRNQHIHGRHGHRHHHDSRVGDLHDHEHGAG
jgi:signal peptidase